VTQIASSGTKAYAYDDAFRITGIQDYSNSANSYAYGYDALDRLTSAVKTGTTRGWTYDANGNRLSETGASPAQGEELMDEHGRSRLLWVGGSVLLLVVIGFVVGLPLVRVGDNAVGAARHTLTVTAELLERFRQQRGVYPRDIHEIDALLAGDIPAANAERLHTDPWGHPITYRFPARDPMCEFELYSKGPNGRDEQGGGDDVVVDVDGRRPGCPTSR